MRLFCGVLILVAGMGSLSLVIGLAIEDQLISGLKDSDPITFLVVVIAVLFIGLVLTLGIKQWLDKKRMDTFGIKSVGFGKSLTKTGLRSGYGYDTKSQVDMVIEVVKADGMIVETKVRAFIHMKDVSEFQPGFPIPIIYNPNTLECVADEEPDPEIIKNMTNYYQSIKR